MLDRPPTDSMRGAIPDARPSAATGRPARVSARVSARLPTRVSARLSTRLSARLSTRLSARVRRSLAVAGTVGLLAIALAGCSAGDVDDEAPGGTLTVYGSAPAHGPDAAEGEAIANGAKLALVQAGGEVAGKDVNAVWIDNTSERGGQRRWDPAVVADNARRAAQDSSAIAYIGELRSAATRISLPITNQARMLHVSAGATAVGLAREEAGSNDVPERVQPTGERTFGRVIPDDEAQASAGAAWARRLGASEVRVVDDGSEFGELMATQFAEEAEALGMEVVDRGSAELVYLAGSSPRLLPRLRGGDVAAEGETGVRLDRTLVASDAFLVDPQPLERLGDLAGGLRLTSSAQDPEQLPPAGRSFARDYRRHFGERPNRYAAYGYEAMAAVLDSIERAAEPEDRSAVIDAFFATRDRESVLGTYSIDQVGNTTLDQIAGYRVAGGEPVFETALRLP